MNDRCLTLGRAEPGLDRLSLERALALREALRDAQAANYELISVLKRERRLRAEARQVNRAMRRVEQLAAPML